nr:DUF4259 domain-containing protein [uncultured Rhodoferax sp.]
MNQQLFDLDVFCMKRPKCLLVRDTQPKVAASPRLLRAEQRQLPVIASTRRESLLFIAAVAAIPNYARAGAWSHESFANDGALDWVAEFQKTPTLEFLRSTLVQGTAGEYIEHFAGECIIAAAEVVAASLGRPSPQFPKELAPVVLKSAAQFKSLAAIARSALTGGVLGAKSELLENWSLHAEGLARWKGSVSELLKRL